MYYYINTTQQGGSYQIQIYRYGLNEASVHDVYIALSDSKK